MVKRKLNPFTADEAGDSFTPSVKTLVGGDLSDDKKTDKKSEISKLKKSSSAKTKKSVSKPTEKKTIETKTKDSVKSESGPAPLKSNMSGSQKSEAEKTPEPSLNKPSSVDKSSKESAVKKQETQIQPRETLPEKARKQKSVKAKRTKSKKEADEVKEVIYELVGFMLGNEEFAIDINNVHEINRMVDITPVPRAPFFVVGVMNLRGNVVPVVNLRRRLNIEDKEYDKKTRIIVVEVLGTVVGFVVDAVSEVLRISASVVEPASDLVAGIQAEYIQGVAKLKTRLMVLLDLEKILAKENIDQLKETSL